MSKGSSPRPLSVPQETFAQRWERTFGRLPREATHFGIQEADEYFAGVTLADPETKETT
jgi:hypothetical protein